MDRERLYRIRELARRCGVSTRTIDYYTQLGLIEPAVRSTGNYRLYDETAVQRLQLVKALQGQRLSLQEIRDRLGCGAASAAGDERSVERMLELLSQIGADLARVQRELSELGAALERCGALREDAQRALSRTASDAMVRAFGVAQVLALLANDSVIGRW